MCGISAYASSRSRNFVDAAKAVLTLLIELQHRGQEAAGIASVDTATGDMNVIKRGLLILDLLSEFLKESKNLAKEVFGCLGHTRYSTSGSYGPALAQPIVIGNGKLKLALAFNGNIANYRELHEFARSVAPEVAPKAENDTEALAQAIYALSKEEGWDVVEALRKLPEYVVGAYSMVAITSEPRLIVARDPRGFRPLSFSFDGTEMFVASETSALQVLDLEWREVKEGEIVSFDGKSLEVSKARISAEPSPCIFEYVYFSRPDSYFNGVNVYSSRIRMGESLAKVMPVDADVVMPVPDSARPMALGYSMASGIPLGEGLVANKYVGRVFISSPDWRDALSKFKYGVIKPVVNMKRAVIVDDSIVRGTTMSYLISKIRRAGAREVHVRIASPPFRCPCFMGIDVASRKELLAWSKSSVDEIREALGADSLAYNTIQNLISSVGLPNVCHACFSCSYRFFGFSVDELEKMSSGRSACVGSHMHAQV